MTEDGALSPQSVDVATNVDGGEQAHASKSKNNSWGSAEAWGQASRGFALSFLLGMSLVVFLQLSFAGEWIQPFLSKNKMPMDERMWLIYQMLAGGAVVSLGGLLPVLFGRRLHLEASAWEKWCWFLSPAIILPALPVALAHEVWRGKHESLLPVLLFGGLIFEVLLSRSLGNVPPFIRSTLTRFFPEDAANRAETVEVNDTTDGADTVEVNDTTEPPKARGETPERKSIVVAQFHAFIDRHFVLLVVILAALAYGAFMSFYTIRWHNKLGTAIFDLGINNNLLYGGLEGKFNQSSVIFPEDPQKYLANHVKIGLYSLLPIYALYPKPETLLALQSVSLGLGAIPLFLFARRRIPQWWAAALALCYLAYYPMHGANFYEMKVVPTAAAIVLACIWAIDSKRWVAGSIFFLWALTMREDLPVPLAVVGIVFLLSGHRPRAGFIMATVASTWFILLRFRFMNEVGSWWFPNMYEDLWAAPEKGFGGVIKTLLTNPTYTLDQIFVEKKFWYLMHLLVPLAFLPARRWYGWAAFVPGAILTLLVTDYAPPLLFSFQYVMHWSPYLFIAAALVLSAMMKEIGGRNRARAALASMCFVSAALTYNYGAFPARDKALESGYHKISFGFNRGEADKLRHVRRMLEIIPQDATVGATERVGAHFSSRVGFYTLRRGSHDVDYMVARKKGLRLDRTRATIYKGLKSGKYGVDSRHGPFIIFKKGADTKENEKVIKEWRLDSKTKTRSKTKSTSSRRATPSKLKNDISRDDNQRKASAIGTSQPDEKKKPPELRSDKPSPLEGKKVRVRE